MSKDLFNIKIEDQETQVEYAVSPLANEEEGEGGRTIIEDSISDIDRRILDVQGQIDEYNKEIDKLTNHADVLDNIVAVSSGVLCALIDSFFVGEFNMAAYKANSHKHVNKFIEDYAKMNGYDGKGLKGAISFLEQKFPVDQDNVWKDNSISSTKLHHLEDIAHHPTPIGLLAAMAVSFFRFGIFVDKGGDWHLVPISTDYKQLLRIWLPILISGVMLWLIHLAESKHPERMDKLPKGVKKLITLLVATPAVIEILKVAYNWFGHLVSDMGGSKNTAGGGMGIPGLFLSLLKELASVPPLNMTPLSRIVSDFYSKDKFDMRKELAVAEYLGKQSIPVILNEVIVRTFYFVRRLIQEKREHESWSDVNWKNVIPFNNRTINRMLTISSGTFMAIDMADAGIRAAVKSRGNMAAFAGNFVLRINFVGVGRFACAVWTDSKMGIQKGRDERARSLLYQQQIELSNAKMLYKSADMWVSAENSSKAVEEVTAIAKESILYFADSWDSISADMSSVADKDEDINNNNPALMDEIKNILD